MLLEGFLQVALFLFQETSHVPPKNIYIFYLFIY